MQMNNRQILISGPQQNTHVLLQVSNNRLASVASSMFANTTFIITGSEQQTTLVPIHRKPCHHITSKQPRQSSTLQHLGMRKHQSSTLSSSSQTPRRNHKTDDLHLLHFTPEPELTISKNLFQTKRPTKKKGFTCFTSAFLHLHYLQTPKSSQHTRIIINNLHPLNRQSKQKTTKKTWTNPAPPESSPPQPCVPSFLPLFSSPLHPLPLSLFNNPFPPNLPPQNPLILHHHLHHHHHLETKKNSPTMSYLSY